uniref:Uncharacterized protein n=1 Tax=Piliocolobus tephrosceles TaxID=591936 RepID=A0A8C9LTS7_9PRIM
MSWRQMTSKICAFQPAQLARLAPDWMCVYFIKDQCSKCFKVLPPLLTLPLLGH